MYKILLGIVLSLSTISTACPELGVNINAGPDFSDYEIAVTARIVNITDAKTKKTTAYVLEKKLDQPARLAVFPTPKVTGKLVTQSNTLDFTLSPNVEPGKKHKIIRFTYKYASSVKDIDTNLKSELETGLLENKISEQNPKNKIDHSMLVTVYEVTGKNGEKVTKKSSLVVNKTEVAFAPVPKGLPNSATVNLDSDKDFRSKGSSGCHTEVEEVK